MPEQQHKKLLDSVTKISPLGTSINFEAKNIAELIDLDDCIECVARTCFYYT